MQDARPTSDRVRVRRQPTRGHYGRDTLDAVLDASLFGHVAFVEDGQPFCVPMLLARIGNDAYIHGSTASRTLRALGTGIPACLTATLLDGLVLARSAYEHSANYRAAVLLGSFRRIEGEDERLEAFEAFTNKVLPGRWDEVREPSAQELKATTILAMPIDEASVKIRTGPPEDDDSDDAALEIWAGVVPFVSSYGEPEASPGLRAGIPVPPSVGRLS